MAVGARARLPVLCRHRLGNRSRRRASGTPSRRAPRAPSKGAACLQQGLGLSLLVNYTGRVEAPLPFPFPFPFYLVQVTRSF